MDGMGNMMDGSGGMMVLGVIVMLVLLGLTVTGIVWLVRSLNKRNRTAITPKANDPREILQRRYADGDIDEDEYFRRLSGIEAP